MAPVLTLASNGLLLAALAWAVVTDLRSRRISNRLTYPLMALGLLSGGLTGGWGGLRDSALGWLLGAAILLVPCLLGAVGAGDLKLMAAIGALKGPEFVLLAAVYTALAGGVLALVELVRVRGPRLALVYVAGGWLGSVRSASSAARAGTIPYGPAIAAGVVIALLRSSLGG